MLLCDFHIHTTYSDGVLPMREVVDLFGRSGHDVIAITDHIVNRDNPLGRIAHAIGNSLNPETWKRYREEIAREAERARATYGMVVIPGAEMTRNTINRDTSVHMLALGLEDFLSADGDPIEMLKEIRARSAVSVACHPHEMGEFYANTWYLWNRRKIVAGLVDLWEVGCRWELFPVVLAREASAHRQQRLPPPGAPLRMEDPAQGRKDRDERSRNSAQGHGHRRPAPDAGVFRGDRMTAALVLLCGLAASVAAYGLSTRALRLHRRDARGQAVPGFTPSVSIVKPLAGPDDRLEENLESFFRLDYPDYEVIFSFASEGDAAFAIARSVADRHPEVPSVFVVDSRELGANSKVNRLAAGVRRARGRFLLFSDGNVRVEPRFLRKAVGFFSDPSVGLVSHLFRASGARTLASRIESLHLNGGLQAGTVAIARWLGTPCVVGKSILMSRSALNAIGGFSAVRDYLAEDFLLGTLVAGVGYRVVLCADELETAEVAKSLRAVWSRHRRWAILRKRLGGPAYLAEVLLSPTPWFVGTIAASGGQVGVVAAGALLLLLRTAIESRSAAQAERPLQLLDYFLIPLRDAGVAAVFFAGLLGARTVWRGRALQVGRGTLLVSETRSPALGMVSELR